MNRPLWTRNRQPDPCDAINLLLSLYTDGMASEEESRRVEAHLPGCISCRQSLVWMQATRKALAARPIQLPPADLRARISSAIAASSAMPAPVRPARVFALRSAYAAAASLTLIGIWAGYGLLKPKPAHVHAAPPQVAIRPVPSVGVPQGQPTHPSRRAGGLTPPLVAAVPPKPRLKTPSASERIASSGVSDTMLTSHETQPIPRVAPAVPELKPQARRIPLKQPILATPAVKLMATRHMPEPSLVHAPSVIAPNRGSATDTVVATSQLPPAPISPSSEPPVIVKEDPRPTVTPSEPPAALRTASASPDLLGAVHAYVHVHQTGFERNLNLTGRTAIRTAAHVTTASDMDVESGKIDITHGDIH